MCRRGERSSRQQGRQGQRTSVGGTTSSVTAATVPACQVGFALILYIVRYQFRLWSEFWAFLARWRGGKSYLFCGRYSAKGLFSDLRELVEGLLLILKIQEEQISEQRVKVKGLAQQLISIEEFLNNCKA